MMTFKWVSFIYLFIFDILTVTQCFRNELLLFKVLLLYVHAYSHPICMQGRNLCIMHALMSIVAHFVFYKHFSYSLSTDFVELCLRLLVIQLKFGLFVS